ncbi:hypothetical protein [Paenibacillus sp. 1_12]|uniref:hypothetical protein n=1 Tax=Paenibacillus sp. 1_12 TaxID=1566278 RepID=UPI000B864D2D|nr:hypothetical protein [Paenibacillus sp. 1_12]
MLDITGYWAQNVIFHADYEEEGIVFVSDGTGFLFWNNLFVETIDYFRWSLDDDKISMTGVKQFTFREDKLSEVKLSKVNVKDVEVKRVKRKNLNDEEVDAIEFSESLTMFSDSRYGFVRKDVWEIDHYRNLKELILNASVTNDVGT